MSNNSVEITLRESPQRAHENIKRGAPSSSSRHQDVGSPRLTHIVVILLTFFLSWGVFTSMSMPAAGTPRVGVLTDSQQRQQPVAGGALSTDSVAAPQPSKLVSKIIDEGQTKPSQSPTSPSSKKDAPTAKPPVPDDSPDPAEATTGRVPSMAPTNNIWEPTWTVESGSATLFTLPTQVQDVGGFTKKHLPRMMASAAASSKAIFNSNADRRFVKYLASSAPLVTDVAPSNTNSTHNNKTQEEGQFNISKIDARKYTLPKPGSARNGKQVEDADAGVAMCFYGLFRFVGTVDRTWRRTQRNVEHIKNRNIFVSTWNYEQLTASGSKAMRRRHRSWFKGGGRVDNMPSRLQAIFGNELKGYFVGDHEQVTKVCRFAHCVVATVRSNCLHAVHAYEQKAQKIHQYFMFHRIDRSLEIPLWFTPACGKSVGRTNFSTAASVVEVDVNANSSSEKDAMSQPPSTKNGDITSTTSGSCLFRAGFCTSYFRHHFFAPSAPIKDGLMTTHLFMCRWNRQHGTLSLMSDYAAIGTRNTVASLLVRVIGNVVRDLNYGGWFAEGIVANAANAERIKVHPVNLGYDRPASMGVMNDTAVDPGGSLRSEHLGDGLGVHAGDEGSNGGHPAENNQPSDGSLDGAEKSATASPIATRTSNASTAVLATVDPTTPLAQITCGVLAPKYMLDLCDWTGRGGEHWDIPPDPHPHWKRAGKTCCSTLRGCVASNRPPKKGKHNH